MEVKQIAIYGGGGGGREIAWLAEECCTATESFEVVCFIDDNQEAHGTLLNGYPVMGLHEAWDSFPQARIVGAVGSPHTRERLMKQAAALGFGFESLIHPRAERSRWIEIGLGTVICAGTVLTTNIVLGEHVKINMGCTVGHDVVMGDYATLSHGVHVSGCVHLGCRMFAGVGAVIVNGTLDDPIVIGDDAVIGAAACVTKSVPAGVTVMGIPARPVAR